MRLARLVAAGLVIGAVVGFAVELLRPRRDLRTSVPQRPAQTPPPAVTQRPRTPEAGPHEDGPHEDGPHEDGPHEDGPREAGRHRGEVPRSDGPAFRVPDQPGADLPTRPLPLPDGTALTGTGGTR